MDQNQNNVKNKVEALLFSSARRMNIEEISDLTGIKDIETIKRSLNELKMEYTSRGGSVDLQEDGSHWKLAIKDHYLSIVQKIVSKTELDKPLIETLAVIAWKYPILQSEVIRIRHNKAYDHMKQLDELGFIIRNKFGRTKKITLTEKFFEYFDLPSKEAKEAFKNVVPINVKDKVEKTEQEITEGEKTAEEIKRKKEESKKIKEEQIKKEKENTKPQPNPHEPPVPDPTTSEDSIPQPNPHEPPIPDPTTSKESSDEIKQEIKEDEQKEEEELEEIQKTEEDLEEEEKKEFYK